MKRLEKSKYVFFRAYIPTKSFVCQVFLSFAFHCNLKRLCCYFFFFYLLFIFLLVDYVNHTKVISDEIDVN